MDFPSKIYIGRARAVCAQSEMISVALVSPKRRSTTDASWRYRRSARTSWPLANPLSSGRASRSSLARRQCRDMVGHFADAMRRRSR